MVIYCRRVGDKMMMLIWRPSPSKISVQYSSDGCIRRFLLEDLYIAEACLLQHVLQLLWRINGHAFNHIRPYGVTLYHFSMMAN